MLTESAYKIRQKTLCEVTIYEIDFPSISSFEQSRVFDILRIHDDYYHNIGTASWYNFQFRDDPYVIIHFVSCVEFFRFLFRENRMRILAGSHGWWPWRTMNDDFRRKCIYSVYYKFFVHSLDARNWQLDALIIPSTHFPSIGKLFGAIYKHWFTKTNRNAHASSVLYWITLPVQYHGGK